MISITEQVRRFALEMDGNDIAVPGYGGTFIGITLEGEMEVYCRGLDPTELDSLLFDGISLEELLRRKTIRDLSNYSLTQYARKILKAINIYEQSRTY